jgi:hypothetical protein
MSFLPWTYSSGQKFGQLKCVLQLWQQRSADTVSITVTCGATDNAQQQWLSWLSCFPAVLTGVRSNPGRPRVKICARALALALALAARRTSTKHQHWPLRGAVMHCC